MLNDNRYYFDKHFIQKNPPPPHSIGIVRVSPVLSQVGDHKRKPSHDAEDTDI